MIAPLTPELLAALLRVRPVDAHKGIMGHALLWAGSPGIAGCAMLAAEACLRSGVGKLTVLTPEVNRVVLQTAVPEAIVGCGTTDFSSYQSLGIGPGISPFHPFQGGSELVNLIKECFKGTSTPVILDADALHIIAEQPSLLDLVKGRAILTPHMGEMKHLVEGLGMTRRDAVDNALQMAEEHMCVVVLKGHPTHICLPRGEIFACPRGNAGMATAGSGDVLTGILTGLLAQGYTLREAALLGVWLHASAGDAAAQEMEQECMIARDIIRHLPQAFRELKKIK